MCLCSVLNEAQLIQFFAINLIKPWIYRLETTANNTRIGQICMNSIENPGQMV